MPSRDLYGPYWPRNMPFSQIPRRQWIVHLETGYGLFCAAIRNSVLDEIERIRSRAMSAVVLMLDSAEPLSTEYGDVQIKTKVKAILPRAIHQKICKSRWEALSKADRDWWVKTAKLGPIFYSDVQARMAHGPPWAIVRKFVRTRRIAFYWSELRAKEMKPGGELYKADHAAFEAEMGR